MPEGQSMTAILSAVVTAPPLKSNHFDAPLYHQESERILLSYFVRPGQVVVRCVIAETVAGSGPAIRVPYNVTLGFSVEVLSPR